MWTSLCAQRWVLSWMSNFPTLRLSGGIGIGSGGQVEQFPVSIPFQKALEFFHEAGLALRASLRPTRSCPGRNSNYRKEVTRLAIACGTAKKLAAITAPHTIQSRLLFISCSPFSNNPEKLISLNCFDPITLHYWGVH